MNVNICTIILNTTNDITEEGKKGMWVHRR